MKLASMYSDDQNFDVLCILGMRLHKAAEGSNSH